tara:strand:+ start:561 stop:803 length:243 start_codon:yes stop_codon:yes gene_type:complete
MAGRGLERRTLKMVDNKFEKSVPEDASSDKNCHPVTHDGMASPTFVDVIHFAIFYKELIFLDLFLVLPSWHGQCLPSCRL